MLIIIHAPPQVITGSVIKQLNNVSLHHNFSLQMMYHLKHQQSETYQK